MMKKTVGFAVAAGAICAFGGRKVSFECDTLDLGEYREYAEIDNTLELVAILEEAEAKGLKVIRTAVRDEFTSVMNLPPVKRLVRELRKKVEIMENYRRGASRLYNIYNK